MNNGYNSSKSAQKYQAFLGSKDGQILKKITGEAILSRLPKSPAVILDAGCGTGWLAAEMAKLGHKVSGLDSSKELLKTAKNNYPGIEFADGDLEKDLPYSQEQFDAIILNMVIRGLNDERRAIQNLSAVLKPKGKIITTFSNPHYAFPIGEWKRGLLGFLLRKKPRLKLKKAYTRLAQQTDSSFVWNGVAKSKFYPLSEHINNFITSGFSLNYYEELKTNSDSSEFDLNYQLYRFPLILLLEFTRL